MVYGTVERHEGRIEIESAVNKGTTVQLILPLRRAPAPQVSTAPLDSDVPVTLNILCIDDEPLLREMLKEILEFYQHRVETADGGEAGLELFNQAKTQGRPFDVVITDLGMPGVNGRQVAERIKSQSPRTAVIMLTGWGTMLEEKGEGAAKVDAVLSKPPRVNELLETVGKVAGVAVASEAAFGSRHPAETAD